MKTYLALDFDVDVLVSSSGSNICGRSISTICWRSLIGWWVVDYLVLVVLVHLVVIANYLIF